jgi:uncharacterized damage-inducible protein DinB
MMLEHLRRMGRYNRWANRRLYEACAKLPEAEYLKPRPAFFGSLHGTLCHLLIADWAWLDRVEGRPPRGLALDHRPFGDLASLRAAREAEDARIVALMDDLDEAALGEDVVYRTITAPQKEMRTPHHLCLLHMFNHQTHHRGQAHDQLSQTEVAPPPLDLIYYLREEAAT